MPEKNKIYEVKIDTVNNLGYGVCRIEGPVCFVKGGVTGDTLDVKVIKVNKNYCVGRIEKSLFLSDKHRTPTCPVYKNCGGCCFSHIDYKHELELKKEFVAAEFKKAGLSIKTNDVVSANITERYRNKAQYPVNEKGEIGFYAERSHDVCECSDCELQPTVFADIVRIIKNYMTDYSVTGYNEKSGKGLIRHIYLRIAKKTNEINVCVVINGTSLPHSDELVTILKSVRGITGVCININTQNTNVILGKKFITLYGRDYIEDELCGLKFRISPASFYQINRDCAELLYSKAAELVKKGKCDNITDLYCGTGTIGLCVAKQIKDCNLTGIEIVPEAIENAKLNAKLNDIKNADFICADSSDTQNGILEKSDVVILDPPRKGITTELAEKIAEAEVKRIVYISCSPDTLARDVKYFSELGYTCEEVTPFDMFPRTAHVETVVCLTRNI